uniref:AbrB/MazE/SpoVT family DNA-binding domain-containing protein n=1 Tax=Thermofilum pendens TaxID=2269 RepID=A0A7C3WV14_THEPE
MSRVKVTRSFQVTIPKEVRETLGIRVGDYLNVYLDDKGRIVMEKASLCRKTFRTGRLLTPEEIDELVARGLGESIAGGSNRH